MQQQQRLPKPFLRTLEADLRALCADARRTNPKVKQAAERVILSLKEADHVHAEANATDQAAAVFCAACESHNQSSPSSSTSVHYKVSLRAVSCLHRLVTHRALNPNRLPDVLDALQRLSTPCFQDNVTLKVLQGLLSLLTVRSYTCSLSEHDLSRAFSLLFQLKSIRLQNKGNPASNALSAISQMSAPLGDAGVIEQTANAAFRQVASDLFAAAADAAVRTAVQRKSPSTEFIPLVTFPNEAKAAFSLFLDLCHAISSEHFEWMAIATNTSRTFHPALAIEVIDDALATNISLFAGQPVFSQLLSGRLCPSIHKLLHSTKHKHILKSLLSLIVTLVRNYWRNLRPDSETLCYALTSLAKSSISKDPPSQNSSWSAVYAMEALRCIFRSTSIEASPLVDFTLAFDLGESSGKCISGVVGAVCDELALIESPNLASLSASSIVGSMKPFANYITNTPQFIVSIAIGLEVDIIKAAEHAAQDDKKDVSSILMPVDVAEKVVTVLGKIVEKSTTIAETSAASGNAQQSHINAFRSIADSLARIAIVSDACSMTSLREKTITTLCSACGDGARSISTVTDFAAPSSQMKLLFQALFTVASKCTTTLGRSWIPIIDAFEQLDSLHRKVSIDTDKTRKPLLETTTALVEKLQDFLTCTRDLPWNPCHDLISALVRCSRQSVAQLEKKFSNDDGIKPDLGSSTVRIFGIVAAEAAILNALRRPDSSEKTIPSALWQLLTGHLASICNDSGMHPLRSFALASLTRVACGALENGENSIISHHRIVGPFLDLFSSPYQDVHLGALSAIYSILETNGEQLKGDSAWQSLLNILRIPTGSQTFSKENGTFNSLAEEMASDSNIQSFRLTTEMVSDGFKVVQAIADDFLSSISKNSLRAWVSVLGLYSRQSQDVNVALTSIGLIWRTADFIAKVGEVGKNDDLWVTLFKVLKDVSIDERPEIRNCAVKTLTGALSAHSPRLSAIAWNGCAAKALLPLLEEVMRGGSATTPDDNSIVNKNRSDMQLLMHHSRDTPRKQWNETRVLALAGVAKVLRTAMPRLAVLHDKNGRPLFLMLTDGGAAGLWRKMLRAAGVAAASRDGEVAVAGVSALLELLSAAGLVLGTQPSGSASNLGPSPSGSALSISNSGSWISSLVDSSEGQSQQKDVVDEIEIRRVGTVSLWEAVWSALSEAISGREQSRNEGSHHNLNEPKLKVVDEKALRILSQGLIDARKKLADKFTPSSSKMLVEVLIVLSLWQQDPDENTNLEVEAHLTEVQDVTLKGVEELSFGNDEASWSALIEGMLEVLSRVDISNRTALNSRILRLILRMYHSNETPSSVKALQTANVLKVLGKIMVNSRARSDSSKNPLNVLERSNVLQKQAEVLEPIWIQATEVVVTAMKRGSEKCSPAQAEEIWREFAKLADQMLYKEKTRPGNERCLDNLKQTRREENDINVIDCVKEGLCQMSNDTSSETKQKLVRLIGKGAEEGQDCGRPRFVRACQKSLFELTEREQHKSIDPKITEKCVRCATETSAKVLGYYNADGHRAGKCPLPAARRAEAVFVLQQLKKMKKTDKGAQQMLSLQATLCECVESRDEAVKWLARELLGDSAPVVKSGAG